MHNQWGNGIISKWDIEKKKKKKERDPVISLFQCYFSYQEGRKDGGGGVSWEKSTQMCDLTDLFINTLNNYLHKIDKKQITEVINSIINVPCKVWALANSTKFDKIGEVLAPESLALA